MTNTPQAVYMDNHATTRVDPRVVEAMLPYFGEVYGNAASIHSFGETASVAVQAAREEIAACIGAKASEIIFTSGATESNNLAIRGVADRPRRRGDHLICVSTEHSAVLSPFTKLEKQGFEVTLLSVAQQGEPNAGRIDLAQLADAIHDDTLLVSIMHANNESGVIQPMAEIGTLCKERGVLLHSDATQGVGRLPLDVNKLGVDLMSFTAHKIYGPKGIGALYVRSSDPIVRLESQQLGGGQMEGRRSGTLNVPGIVGFAAAMKLCNEEIEEEMTRLAGLRNRLASEIAAAIEGVSIVGPSLTATDDAGQPLRLPGNLGLTFAGIQGQALMLNMPNLAVSSGATCATAAAKPSHVLAEMGMTEDQARGSLRFGLGRFTTEEDIDFAVKSVIDAAAKLRQLG